MFADIVDGFASPHRQVLATQVRDAGGRGGRPGGGPWRRCAPSRSTTVTVTAALAGLPALALLASRRLA
ncbi:hypothetical protein [Nonomuraea polychroma]|uniref:hypothetical protein n=1 Tax=Nonomuraea polychroma TaxID=46176 RepID=UPI0019D43044|nr:hypothetical protein [Nonomuraea polychroma]